MSRGPAQFPRESNDRGEFVRQESAFRDQVRADGSTAFAPEPGRYHLYVSLACPWAHRTIIARRLKGLEDVISMSIVDPIRDERGWAFREGPGHGPDPVNGFAFLAEAYRATDPDFDGRVTVPVLWDRATRRIVNNESSELLRMFDQEFGPAGAMGPELYPEELRDEIDAINADVYARVNNGVYRCGFAASQEAYDAAFVELFAELDRLETRLTERRYLCGDRLTEADIRLFTTLIRFDAVYVGHFKCNRNRIADYAALSGYTRELYQMPAVRPTVDFDHIKRHYYGTHGQLNPSGIVPLGPQLELDAPHGRD